MIEEWNQYLRSDVWGYDMGLYVFEKDTHGEAIEEFDYYKCHGQKTYEDSCWSFYGSEPVLGQTKDQAEAYIDSLRKK